MARVDTVRLEIEANVANFKKEIEKIPGMTKVEAAKMAADFGKGWKKAERSAKKAMDASKKHTSMAIEAIGSSIDRTMSELGGVFGDIGGKFFTLTESAFQVQNAIGGIQGVAVAAAGAFAGTTLALGYAVGAAYEFIKSTDEMRESLEDFAGVEPIPDETLSALDDFQQASDALEVTWTRFQILIAGDVAPTMVYLANTLVGVIVKIRELTDAAAKARAIVMDSFLGRLLEPIVAPAWLEATTFAMDYFAETGEKAASTIVKLGDGHEKASKSVDAYAEAEKRAYEALEFSKKAMDEVIDAEEDLLKIRKQVTSDLQTQQEKIIENAAIQLAAIQAIEAKIGETQETIEAKGEVEARQTREQTALEIAAYGERNDAFVASIQEMVAAEDEAHQKRVAQMQEILTLSSLLVSSATAWTSTITSMSQDRLSTIEDEAQATKDAFQEWKNAKFEEIDTALAAGDISSAQADKERDNLRELAADKRETMQDELKFMRKNAKKEFNLQKSLAVAEAVMKAAVAYQSLLIGFSVGPGSGLAAVAGAFLGSTAPLLANLASINAMQPPSFPTGGLVGSRVSGSPDHVMIGAQRDEGIVSRRGMAALGEDGLDAINAGRGAGGSTIILQLDRRTIASAVVSLIGSSSQVSAALDARSGTIAGRAPVYGSG